MTIVVKMINASFCKQVLPDDKFLPVLTCLCCIEWVRDSIVRMLFEQSFMKVLNLVIKTSIDYILPYQKRAIRSLWDCNYNIKVYMDHMMLKHTYQI